MENKNKWYTVHLSNGTEFNILKDTFKTTERVKAADSVQTREYNDYGLLENNDFLFVYDSEKKKHIVNKQHIIEICGAEEYNEE